MNKLHIETPTRMNDLNIEIPLMGDMIFDKSDPKLKITLNINSLEIKNINKYVGWFQDNLYNITHFGIEGDKYAKIKIIDSKYLFMKPPVVINSMTRGNIINSVSYYTLSISFYLNFVNTEKLLSYYKNNQNKDLKHYFISKEKENKLENSFVPRR